MDDPHQLIPYILKDTKLVIPTCLSIIYIILPTFSWHFLKGTEIGSERTNSGGILQLDSWIPVYIISCVTHLIESHGETLSLCDLIKTVTAEFKQNTTASCVNDRC